MYKQSRMAYLGKHSQIIQLVPRSSKSVFLHCCSSVCTRNTGCCCSPKQKDLEVLPAICTFPLLFPFFPLAPTSNLCEQNARAFMQAQVFTSPFLFGSLSSSISCSLSLPLILVPPLLVNTLFSPTPSSLFSDPVSNYRVKHNWIFLPVSSRMSWRPLHSWQWIFFSSLGHAEHTGLDFCMEQMLEERQWKEGQTSCWHIGDEGKSLNHASLSKQTQFCVEKSNVEKVAEPLENKKYASRALGKDIICSSHIHGKLSFLVPLWFFYHCSKEKPNN